MLSPINLPPKVINREMELIFTPVKFGDSGIVMCYPACHQDFNVVRFLTFKKKLKKILGLHHNRFAFLLVHLNSSDSKKSFLEKFRSEGQKYAKKINPSDNLQQICQKILNAGKDPYLFLFNAHSVKTSVLNSIVLSVHELILSINRFGVLLFFEANIYDQDFIKIFSTNNKFLRNAITIPTYSSEETKWYLRSIAKEWKMKLSEKTVNEIIGQCFGYLWVMREIVRLIKINKNYSLPKILNTPNVRWRLETILKMLKNNEKLVILNMLNQRLNQKDQEINSYLLETGIVVKKNKRYLLPLKPLENLLSKMKIVSNFYLADRHNIIFDQKNITSNFTNSELKILKLLLSKKGYLVNRDEIAQAIWGKQWEEKYSDWAIDKLVSRIRSTLIKLGLPKDIIQTKKGQGFLLINP